MDDIFAGLVEQGRQVEETLKAQLQQAQAAECRAEEERWAFNLARLRDALGIAPAEEALWQALAPEHNGHGYSVRAYGVRGHIYDNLSGWSGDAIPGKVTRESLALFVVYARNVRAQVKAKVLQVLQSDDINAYRAEQQRACVADGLWDDPEVKAARLDFLMRTRITDITTAPAFWWYRVWLEESERLPLDYERAEVLSLRERATAWADLDWRLTMTEENMLTAEQIAAWRVEAEAFGSDAPQKWFKILDRLELGIAEACAVDAWIRERAQLEAAAFFPFRYYAVGYGYLTDTEEGFRVETDTIPTLYMPDAGDWLVDARNGSRVQVRAITTITEVDVYDVAALPTWPGCWRGMGNRRYQVPPEGAERL